MSLIEDTLKTKRVIESCINYQQVDNAYNYLLLFKNKYKFNLINDDKLLYSIYNDLYSSWLNMKDKFIY